jgi:hypothetical protein
MEEIVECATRAVALDDRGDYDGALEAYAVVCEKLFAFIPTCKKGGESEKSAKRSLKAYIERSELLKALLPTLKTSPRVCKMVGTNTDGPQISREDYDLLEQQLKTAEELQKITLKRKVSAEEKLRQMQEDTARLQALEKIARDDFLCPITMEIMNDPVVALDGHTYERDAITEWYTKHDNSPMTGLPVDSKSLVANHTLRSAIISWREATKDLDTES